MDKGNHGQPIRAEIAAEAKMHTRKNAVPHIAPHILPAQSDDFSIVRKQADRAFRHKLHDNRSKQTKTNGNHRCIFQSVSRPVMSACADILRRQRRYGREHGRRYQEKNAYQFFHNAYRRRIAQPPAVRKDRYDDKRNLDKSVLYGHRDAHF